MKSEMEVGLVFLIFFVVGWIGCRVGCRVCCGR